MSLQNIDFNKVETIQDQFAPIPRAWYACVITDTDDCPNKNNDGRFLKLELQIGLGDFKNRKVWTYINYENKNEEVANRAKSEIKKILEIASIPGFDHRGSAILIGKKLDVRIYTDEKKDENKVVGFRAYDQANHTASSVALAPTGRPAPTPPAPQADTQNFDDDIPF
jgi:hypothetical protein